MDIREQIEAGLRDFHYYNSRNNLKIAGVVLGKVVHLLVALIDEHQGRAVTPPAPTPVEPGHVQDAYDEHSEVSVETLPLTDQALIEHDEPPPTPPREVTTETDEIDIHNWHTNGAPENVDQALETEPAKRRRRQKD